MHLVHSPSSLTRCATDAGVDGKETNSPIMITAHKSSCGCLASKRLNGKFFLPIKRVEINTRDTMMTDF